MDDLGNLLVLLARREVILIAVLDFAAALGAADHTEFMDMRMCKRQRPEP